MRGNGYPAAALNQLLDGNVVESSAKITARGRASQRIREPRTKSEKSLGKQLLHHFFRERTRRPRFDQSLQQRTRHLRLCWRQHRSVVQTPRVAHGEILAQSRALHELKDGSDLLPLAFVNESIEIHVARGYKFRQPVSKPAGITA
jgi:hypothetical protein